MQTEYENAPWNDSEDLKECTISCSYSKTVNLKKYETFEDVYWTIPELLNLLENLCKARISDDDKHKKFYENVIFNCKNWIEDEFSEFE